MPSATRSAQPLSAEGHLTLPWSGKVSAVREEAAQRIRAVEEEADRKLNALQAGRAPNPTNIPAPTLDPCPRILPDLQGQLDASTSEVAQVLNLKAQREEALLAAVAMRASLEQAEATFLAPQPKFPVVPLTTRPAWR